MKYLLHIFTLYMLFLVLLPCGDGGGGLVEIANHFFGLEHQHLTDHEQHSNDCGDDACSPFCICSCCSTSMTTPTKWRTPQEALTPVPGTTPSFIPNFISSSIDRSIWQPPRRS